MNSRMEAKERLAARGDLPLHPKRPFDEGLSEKLSSDDPRTWFDAHIESVSEEHALAVKAGLLLWNDDLARSHEIAQQLENEVGSLWHAIMHRREGDHSNSKYWYSHAGDHPIFAALARELPSLCEGDASLLAALNVGDAFVPFRFVDAVEMTSGAGDAREAALKRIQEREIQLLLDHCEREAAK